MKFLSRFLRPIKGREANLKSMGPTEKRMSN